MMKNKPNKPFKLAWIEKGVVTSITQHDTEAKARAVVKLSRELQNSRKSTTFRLNGVTI